MDQKTSASFDDQIQTLKSKGCFIADEMFAKIILQQVSNYRLKAYFLPFRNRDGSFVNGTSFDTVYRIYEFDRKLRILIFSAVEEIEIMLRSQLSYFHSMKYGTFGYTNADNFNRQHDENKFNLNIQKAISQNKKQPFVEHYITNYDSQFPLWVIIELFSMGELSFFFSDMRRADKKALSRSLFKTTDTNVSSWLICLTKLRNYCAHYSRLYFNKFSTVPATPKNFPYILNDRIFDYLLVLSFLYPDKNKWKSSFLVNLASLIEEYNGVINMNHIGFPENWQTLLKSTYI